jgi:hypothetical protein
VIAITMRTARVSRGIGERSFVAGNDIDLRMR